MDKFTNLQNWYHTPLGRSLATAVSNQMDALLPRLFGYHLLQIGLPDQIAWTISSPIKHKIFLSTRSIAEEHSLVASEDLLPIANDSIDVLILPHTLELAENPYQVLGEMQRVLVNNGHAIIVGFNPISMWGIWKKLRFRRKQAPWDGNYMSALSVRRQSANLGMQLKSVRNIFYRPPVSKSIWLNRLLFLETFGRLAWSYPGAAYVMLLQKQETTLMPIKPLWRFHNLVIGKRQATGTNASTFLAERNVHNGQSQI